MLMVLINVPVRKEYSRNYFSFFIRSKNIEKAELECIPSECVCSFFSYYNPINHLANIS